MDKQYRKIEIPIRKKFPILVIKAIQIKFTTVYCFSLIRLEKKKKKKNGYIKSLGHNFFNLLLICFY